MSNTGIKPAYLIIEDSLVTSGSKYLKKFMIANSTAARTMRLKMQSFDVEVETAGAISNYRAEVSESSSALSANYAGAIPKKIGARYSSGNVAVGGVPQVDLSTLATNAQVIVKPDTDGYIYIQVAVQANDITAGKIRACFEVIQAGGSPLPETV